jgi:soluble lytic murein transglycosylase
VTAGGPAPRGGRRARGLVFAAVVVVAVGAGYGLVRAFPTRSDVLDAVGDPLPDLSAVDGALVAAAKEAGVEVVLLRALTAVESAGNPRVVSHAGAVGLLQLMDTTAAEQARKLKIAGPLDLTDPTLNARLGARYLATLLADFGGDEILAVAAYNAGPLNVRRWLERAADADSRAVIDREGFPETRRHVERILRFRKLYAAR